tara:strand:+ start:15 stop:125 length:111 start_codon:yes stop_codon:yes gene_type:complete
LLLVVVEVDQTLVVEVELGDIENLQVLLLVVTQDLH